MVDLYPRKLAMQLKMMCSYQNNGPKLKVYKLLRPFSYLIEVLEFSQLASFWKELWQPTPDCLEGIPEATNT